MYIFILFIQGVTYGHQINMGYQAVCWLVGRSVSHTPKKAGKLHFHAPIRALIDKFKTISLGYTYIQIFKIYFCTGCLIVLS